MFHVYYLTNDGEYMLTSRHHDEDDALDAVDALSERMPNAYCDYVYKDINWCEMQGIEYLVLVWHIQCHSVHLLLFN